MSNSIAPGSSADVNVKVTALTTNPNVPVTYKTIILKKNLVNGVNTLTQEMMSAINTKYVIKYDYMLGEDITVPENCILEFDGGSISGNYNISGKVLNDLLKPEWFGGGILKSSSENDKAFYNSISILKEGGILYLDGSAIYNISSSIKLKSNMVLDGNGGTIRVDDSFKYFWRILGGNNLDNVIVKNCIIDTNGNRPDYEMDGNAEKYNSAMQFSSCKNLTIENNIIYNSGVWCIEHENYPEDYTKENNIIVRNNKIYFTIGKHTGDFLDTTQIAIRGNNYQITDNIVISNINYAETAIEAHRCNGALVENNTINGFRWGLHVCPPLDDNVAKGDCFVSHNYIDNCINGICLYVFNKKTLKNIIISDNHIRCNPLLNNKRYSSCGITSLYELNSDNRIIDNIKIENNIIDFYDDTTIYSNPDNILNFAGIKLNSAIDLSNVTINNNTIKNAPAIGIIINGRDSSNINNIQIDSNLIIDCGKNTNISVTDYLNREFIYVGSRITGCSVTNNTFIVSDSNFITKNYSIYSLNTYFDNNYIKLGNSTLYKDFQSIPYISKNLSLVIPGKQGTLTEETNFRYKILTNNSCHICIETKIVSNQLTDGYTMYYNIPLSLAKKTRYIGGIIYSNNGLYNGQVTLKQDNNTFSVLYIELGVGTFMGWNTIADGATILLDFIAELSSNE